MIKKLTPNMMVSDVQKTLDYYLNIMNFSFVMGVPEEKEEVILENEPNTSLVYALVKRDDIEVMFQEKKSLSSDLNIFSNVDIFASVSFYFEVDDLDKVYSELKGKVEIISDIKTTWYGMQEFYLQDCNGYVLGFAARVN